MSTRRRPQARSRRRQGRRGGEVAGWAWLAAGLAIGLFVAFLVYLQGQRRAVPPPPEKPAQPATPAPRFDFYTILPEQEVVVPESEPAPERRAAPRERSRYLLQVGSFRTYAQADALRARLALLGVEATIERVRLAGGEIWHRVRVGPFDSLRELSRIQDRLRRNDIQSIRLKIRG